MAGANLFLGCAGWSLPREVQPAFEPGGSHLQRYASRLVALARRIAIAQRDGREVWCIFDNTAGSAAAHNAVDLRQALDKELQ